jgi:hypothetical protein
VYWLKRIDVKEGATGQDAAGSETAPHRILTAGTCHGQRPAERLWTLTRCKSQQGQIMEWNIGREAEFDGWS